MKPAKTIRSQDWMSASETKAVMAALGQGNALFVGGCVRNALLGEEVEDIDIATKLPPEAVMERLEDAGIKSIPTGIDHGTVTAVVDGKAFEITTLRRDVETDGRHADVMFSDNWAEDAARRDFTMNTLLADQEGNIYDPLGAGLSDLGARKVMFVGKPAQRIEEDYLRILRFFRFHALYGQGAADEQALQACMVAADKIAGLSRERVTQEFFKIMSADNPADILALMFGCGVLKDFEFEAYDPETLKAFCGFQNTYFRHPVGIRAANLHERDPEKRAAEGSSHMDPRSLSDAVHRRGDDRVGDLAARLIVLAGFDLNNLGALQNYLLIPKVFLKDIAAILNILELPDLSDDHAVQVAVYKYGRVPTAQALMIELVQDRVMNGYAPAALEIIQNWDVPDFPLSGEDLIAEGFKPGPELGQALARREQDWIDGGFKD